MCSNQSTKWRQCCNSTAAVTCTVYARFTKTFQNDLLWWSLLSCIYLISASSTLCICIPFLSTSHNLASYSMGALPSLLFLITITPSFPMGVEVSPPPPIFQHRTEDLIWELIYIHIIYLDLPVLTFILMFVPCHSCK
jgi:hypothetical protein